MLVIRSTVGRALLLAAIRQEVLRASFESTKAGAEEADVPAAVKSNGVARMLLVDVFALLDGFATQRFSFHYIWSLSASVIGDIDRRGLVLSSRVADGKRGMTLPHADRCS